MRRLLIFLSTGCFVASIAVLAIVLANSTSRPTQAAPPAPVLHVVATPETAPSPTEDSIGAVGRGRIEASAAPPHALTQPKLPDAGPRQNRRASENSSSQGHAKSLVTAPAPEPVVSDLRAHDARDGGLSSPPRTEASLRREESLTDAAKRDQNGKRPQRQAALQTPYDAARPTESSVPSFRPRPNSVLTNAEIARLKTAMRLSPDQEPHWPQIENVLRAVGAEQMALLRAGRNPEEALSGQTARNLYLMAQPLLGTLREDQKAEIRKRARMLGLQSVVSYI